MGLVKCPRCELNYIQEGEKYCDVCRRSMRREKEPEEREMCGECGENPVVRGMDICAACLREHRRQKKLDSMNEAEPDLLLDDSDDMQEIELPEENDIPESEFEEIHRELGLSDDDDDEEPEEEEE